MIRFTGPNENPRRKSAKTRTLKGGSALPRQALSGIPLMLQRLIRQASRGDPISLILFRIQGDIRRRKRSSATASTIGDTMARGPCTFRQTDLTVALKIRSIREGARLTVENNRRGTLSFRRWRNPGERSGAASPSACDSNGPLAGPSPSKKPTSEPAP